MISRVHNYYQELKEKSRVKETESKKRKNCEIEREGFKVVKTNESGNSQLENKNDPIQINLQS